MHTDDAAHEKQEQAIDRDQQRIPSPPKTAVPLERRNPMGLRTSCRHLGKHLCRGLGQAFKASGQRAN